MDSIEILKQEHRTVLRVAKVARRELKDVGEAHEVAAREMEQLLDFFRYFTNSCHDPKEEDLLFTTLHRRGMSWDDYPLRELVREHEEMRVLLDSASDRLPLVRAGDTAAAAALRSDLKVYLDLLERHIAGEEEALFSVAGELLTARDLETLSEAFTAIACEALEEGVHAYYADFAHELVGAAHA